MKNLSLKTGRRAGFTLVELLVVIAMIALLTGLAMPNFTKALANAHSTQCAGNLRAIGAAVLQATADNDNAYPPIVQDDEGSSGLSAEYTAAGLTPVDLYDALSPYGITTAALKCPMDTGQGYSFPYTVNGQSYTSSYEWNPLYDDEVTTATVVYMGGQFVATGMPVSLNRLRLCTDFNAVHGGRMNILYGDGHVRKH